MSNNPAFNLAREEILCDLCRVGNFEGCFFLWQNEPAVILGRFNNIDDEINIKFARENNIKIVRRNSGGGAVYHDLGNVNYSFILHDEKKYNLKFFADIIINALKKIGINGTLEFNHNDLLINNYKISGMAQYHRDNILLHHGTLLFDSDLGVIQKVLKRASPAKKVMNLKNFLTRDINIQEFMTLLCDIICSQDSIKFFANDNIDSCELNNSVNKLMLAKYLNPDWTLKGEYNHDKIQK